MKTLSLFGGSGKTGQEFLTLALQKGYSVRALVRDPAKIPQIHSGLTVITGDVLDPLAVANTLQGTDLVVSLFGQVSGSPKNLQTEGTRIIVATMKKQGIRKIISLSGGGLPFPGYDQPKLPDRLIRFIMKLAVPHVLEDAINHADVLASSGLDWMIVRGPRLTLQPRKGSYRVGWVGVNASTSIGRADLSDFILSQVESDAYLRQMPFVSY